ncbi:MAG: sugar porter family MFS transporter [Acidobacteriaceae bacterium]
MNIVSVPNEPSPASAPVNRLYLWVVASIAALGGFLFGYDWVVIGGAKPFYEKFFALTRPWQQGWAMSCAVIGCLFGAMASGALSEKFGRKKPLILAAVIFCLSSIGTGLANGFASFVFWRILGGFAIGLASSLSPVYIAELAPAHLRGRLVSLNQLTIVCGILLAQIVNWLIAKPISPTATANDILHSWNGQTGWRWMFCATAIPSLLFLFSMFFVPESPRWLSRQGAAGKAKAVLIAIGGQAYGEEVYSEIQSSIAADQGAPSLRSLLHAKVRPILWLGIFLAVLQQWCGINVIFNYAEEVFSAAGFPVSDILFNIVVTGAVNVLFTIVALRTVDRYGRRVLMLLGCAGLASIYTLLGFFYYLHSRGVVMLFLVVAAIGCFAMSLGPVTWVVISEIFPSKIRGAAVSIAVSALWAACFVLTYTFPFLNHALGAAGTFWIYAGVCAAGFVYLVFRLPETKGKSLETIEQSWS